MCSDYVNTFIVFHPITKGSSSNINIICVIHITIALFQVESTSRFQTLNLVIRCFELKFKLEFLLNCAHYKI